MCPLSRSLPIKKANHALSSAQVVTLLALWQINRQCSYLVIPLFLGKRSEIGLDIWCGKKCMVTRQHGTAGMRSVTSETGIFITAYGGTCFQILFCDYEKVLLMSLHLYEPRLKMTIN